MTSQHRITTSNKSEAEVSPLDKPLLSDRSSKKERSSIGPQQRATFSKAPPGNSGTSRAERLYEAFRKRPRVSKAPLQRESLIPHKDARSSKAPVQKRLGNAPIAESGRTSILSKTELKERSSAFPKKRASFTRHAPIQRRDPRIPPPPPAKMPKRAAFLDVILQKRAELVSLPGAINPQGAASTMPAWFNWRGADTSLVRQPPQGKDPFTLPPPSIVGVTPSAVKAPMTRPQPIARTEPSAISHHIAEEASYAGYRNIDDEMDIYLLGTGKRSKLFSAVIFAAVVLVIGVAGLTLFSSSDQDEKEVEMQMASTVPALQQKADRHFEPLAAAGTSSEAASDSTQAPRPQDNTSGLLDKPVAEEPPMVDASSKIKVRAATSPTAIRWPSRAKASAPPAISVAAAPPPKKSDLSVASGEEQKSALTAILEGDDPSSEKIPVGLNRNVVQRGMKKVARYAKRCSKKEMRPVVVSVTISKSGRVIKAAAIGDFAGTEVGACVAQAARGANFPPSMKETTVQYPLYP
jgi:hypothetical protein